MISFLLGNVEIIGAVLSAIYLLLSIRQNNWCWLFGGLGAALYVLVFFESKFYADMSLQFYYIFISFYGWYNWKYGKHSEEEKQIPITKMPQKQWLLLSILTFLVFSAYAAILSQTDSPVVIGDSFTTATAILATYMLSRKYIEAWLVFVVSDGVCIGLYIYKELYITAFLFVFYTVVAFLGYLDWRKEMLKQISLPTEDCEDTRTLA
jgi:nicotinamide mononucleotide transporter